MSAARVHSTRYARKGFPPDLRGIHWEYNGSGRRHAAGTLWEDDEWAQFKAWALENGAINNVLDVHRVVWRDDDGELSREDGPAIVYSTGTVEWYLHGIRHREDGPSFIGLSGSEDWFLNGQRHREDGPAYYDPAYQAWYLYGKRHRKGGPAVIRRYGRNEWWLNGVKQLSPA